MDCKCYMRSCYHIIPERNDLCCFGCVTSSLLHGIVNLLSFFTFNICCFITKFNKAYCMPYGFKGHLTTTRPFSGNFLPSPLGFSKTKLCTKFEVCSLNNFQDIWDRLPQIFTGHGPRPRPFWEKLFERLLGFSKRKLSTKFEDSS